MVHFLDQSQQIPVLINVDQRQFAFKQINETNVTNKIIYETNVQHFHNQRLTCNVVNVTNHRGRKPLLPSFRQMPKPPTSNVKKSLRGLKPRL